MPYERNYSVMEVARRLEHCEGNVNPGVPMGAPAGHAIAQHRDITDAGLQARHGLSTAFMRHPNAGRIGPLPLGRHQRAYMDLAFALCSVLNIPDVQQLGLRYLDPNPLAPGVIPPKRLVVHCDGQAGGVNVQVSPDGNTVTLDHVRRVQWRRKDSSAKNRGWINRVSSSSHKCSHNRCRSRSNKSEHALDSDCLPRLALPFTHKYLYR